MKALRWLLMGLALIVAIGGGFVQFYLGFHLATDLTAGYLLGLSAAFLGIGLLASERKYIRDNKRREVTDPPPAHATAEAK